MTNPYLTDLPSRLEVLRRVERSPEWLAFAAAITDELPAVQRFINDLRTEGTELAIYRIKRAQIEAILDGSILKNMIRETEAELKRIEATAKQAQAEHARKEREKMNPPKTI